MDTLGVKNWKIFRPAISVHAFSIFCLQFEQEH